MKGAKEGHTRAKEKKKKIRSWATAVTQASQPACSSSSHVPLMKINGDVLGRRRRRKGTYENKQTTHENKKRKRKKKNKNKMYTPFLASFFFVAFPSTCAS
jgi:phage terminase large subunit-like protein